MTKSYNSTNRTTNAFRTSVVSEFHIVLLRSEMELIVGEIVQNWQRHNKVPESKSRSAAAFVQTPLTEIA